jgi:hypothetical protein
MYHCAFMMTKDDHYDGQSCSPAMPRRNQNQKLELFDSCICKILMNSFAGMVHIAIVMDTAARAARQAFRRRSADSHLIRVTVTP